MAQQRANAARTGPSGRARQPEGRSHPDHAPCAVDGCAPDRAGRQRRHRPSRPWARWWTSARPGAWSHGHLTRAMPGPGGSLHRRWAGMAAAMHRLLAQAEAELREAVGHEVATVIAAGARGLMQLLIDAQASTQGARMAKLRSLDMPEPGDQHAHSDRRRRPGTRGRLAARLARLGRSGGPCRQRHRGRCRADDQHRVRPADPGPGPAQDARPGGAASKLRGAWLLAAGADPDRRRQRGGARQGAGLRRRRLHGQALQPARAGSPRARPGAPRHGRRQQHASSTAR